MIKIPTIADRFERECTEYVTNYIHRFTSLRYKTIRELEYYRRTENDLIIIQPPYVNYSNEVKFSDLSIISKSNGIDIRYEISSLIPDSTLAAKALKHALESLKIHEKQFVLVLLHHGYDNIVNDMVLPLIRKDNLPVMVLRTIEQYKNHVDEIFNQNKRKTCNISRRMYV